MSDLLPCPFCGSSDLDGSDAEIVIGSSLLAAALGPTFTLAVLMRGPLKGCPTTKATA